MMKWFSGATTVDELRKEYKKLLLKHHPDNGGLVSDMQEINAEYDRLFEHLKDKPMHMMKMMKIRHLKRS